MPKCNKSCLAAIATLLMLACGHVPAAENTYATTSVDMEVKKVSAHVYYVEGSAGIATDNEGFISNAGFVVTKEGVVVFDALGTPSLADKLVQKIREITPQPIKKVIVSHYHADHIYGLQVFEALGAEIIAPYGAQKYIQSDVAKERLEERQFSLDPWVNEQTHLVLPDTSISSSSEFMLGGLTFTMNFMGKAHSDGDLTLLVEPDKVLFSGDIIFRGRIPFVGSADSKKWLQTLTRLETNGLSALVPGHGPASTDPKNTISLTRRYLAYLRETMGNAVDEFTPFDEAYAGVDWSEFENLPAFKEGNRINAYQVYLSMEAESLEPDTASSVAPSPVEEDITDEDNKVAEDAFVASIPGLSNQSRIMLEQVNARITNIDTQELKTLLEERPETVLIDVRTPEELAIRGGHIDAPRHRNIMRGWLEFQIESYVPDKDTPIVTYCGINQRSPLAADTLMQLGYTNVKNYKDGFFAWKKAGLPVEELDKELDSFLYSRPVEVIPGVWSAIGATAPGSYANSGHNNNLSFIITDDGVIVMNAGDNYLLAKALHDEIKRRTDQPVKYVVLENAQGHAAHGTGYWREQGVSVIAHKDALTAIQAHGHAALDRMRTRLRDKAYKTELPEPDKIIEASMPLQMGSWKIEILYLGPAHSPGGIMLWLPEQKLIITGDMAFNERMLPIFENTDTAAWIETWDKFAALNATTVIPGHGGATDMATVKKWTVDYLRYLRGKIQEVLDEAGDLTQAYEVDQSPYSHLDTFDELAKLNAGMVFRTMEFE